MLGRRVGYETEREEKERSVSPGAAKTKKTGGAKTRSWCDMRGLMVNY
jgi:hypothetical protein